MIRRPLSGEKPGLDTWAGCRNITRRRKIHLEEEIRLGSLFRKMSPKPFS